MKVLGVVAMLGSLAVGVEGCQLTVAAGGWSLFWLLAFCHFGADVLAKLGVWLWKEGR